MFLTDFFLSCIGIEPVARTVTSFFWLVDEGAKKKKKTIWHMLKKFKKNCFALPPLCTPLLIDQFFFGALNPKFEFSQLL